MKTFWHLLKIDLRLLGKSVKNTSINCIVWGGMVCLINGYVIQAFGISRDFGAFIAAGSIVSTAGFAALTQMVKMLADIEGERHVSYTMILPISNTLVWLEKMLVFTLNNFILQLFVLATIQTILWTKWSFMAMLNPFFWLSLLVINVFFAAFTFVLLGLTKHMGELDNVFMRFILPLWILGCFEFSVKIAYGISPILGSICLLSPYTYATEAVRSTLFGPTQYIPLWISLSMLIVFSMAAVGLGISLLKKRLDYV